MEEKDEFDCSNCQDEGYVHTCLSDMCYDKNHEENLNMKCHSCNLTLTPDKDHGEIINMKKQHILNAFREL